MCEKCKYVIVIAQRRKLPRGWQRPKREPGRGWRGFEHVLNAIKPYYPREDFGLVRSASAPDPAVAPKTKDFASRPPPDNDVVAPLFCAATSASAIAPLTFSARTARVFQSRPASRESLLNCMARCAPSRYCSQAALHLDCARSPGGRSRWIHARIFQAVLPWP
jgi:hypothetical protein